MISGYLLGYAILIAVGGMASFAAAWTEHRRNVGFLRVVLVGREGALRSVSL